MWFAQAQTTFNRLSKVYKSLCVRSKSFAQQLGKIDIASCQLHVLSNVFVKQLDEEINISSCSLHIVPLKTIAQQPRDIKSNIPYSNNKNNTATKQIRLHVQYAYHLKALAQCDPLELLVGNSRVASITIITQTLESQKPIHCGYQNGHKTHQHVVLNHFEHCAMLQVAVNLLKMGIACPILHHFNNHSLCGTWYHHRKKDEEELAKLKKYRCKTANNKLYLQCLEIIKWFSMEEECLRKCHHIMNSQKNEAMNKSITRYIPKDKTYARTMALTSCLILAVSIDSLGHVTYYERFFAHMQFRHT
jgi:hypothetical protein